MPFKIGDNVFLVSNPSQHGVVTRVNPLGASTACAVAWPGNSHIGYFGQRINDIELL